MDVLEEIKTRLSLLIDRFLCFDEEPKSSYLKELHANGTIYIVKFESLKKIINHARFLKTHFDFIPFILKSICIINKIAREYEILGDIEDFPLKNISYDNLADLFDQIRPHKTKSKLSDIYISY